MATDQSSWTPSNPNYDPNKPMQIGGQAVIEGVMMRAPGSIATAVRRINGDIVVQQQKFASLVERFPIFDIPVMRGAIGLIDMMYLGIKSLNFSAEVAIEDLEQEEMRKNGGEGQLKKRKKESDLALAATLILALAIGIGVFFITPLVLATYVFELEQNAFEFNLVAGLIRITILLSYLGGISMMKDIRRLFQYHGAEHKAVFAFELNQPLRAEVAQSQTRFHPRCGTSFLLIVMFVAILSFAILDAILIRWFGEMTLLLRLATHLPFVPVVGGLSYEIIKFSARHGATWWGRILVTPGLWLQKITTKEPDESQLEVALVALRCALGQDDAARYPRKAIHVVEAAEAVG